MSARYLYTSDDDEDYVELKYFPCLNDKAHQFSMHKQYSSPEVGVMTMDRKFVKTFEKMAGNAFGTMPRSRIANDGATKATLQTIGAFSNMYNINKEANIIDEELKYLQAVESGNLELVERILFCYAKENDYPDVKTTGNGFHLGMDENTPSNPTFVDETDQKSKSQNDLINDSQEIERSPTVTKKSLPLLSQSSKRNLWTGGSSRGPLPVTLIQNDSKDYLNKQTDETFFDNIGPRHKVKFNKNCRDHWGRSALFIAMIHFNLDMIKLLLRYEVKSEECLYHAIDFRYYDIVEVFMHYEKNKTERITGELSFYPPGLTPFQLAAHKNDYVMLRILHDHGYGIGRDCKKRAFSSKSKKFPITLESDQIKFSVLDRAWDASNHQLHYYRAICSPAYLIMTFDEGIEANSGNWDFLENIFTLYRELKKKQVEDPAVQSLYQPLADQVEEFACDLLSEVRSSSDLANLLRFDPPGQKRLTSQRNYLTPVQRAIEVRMKKFVAHENSQLAVSSLRLGTLFKSEHGLRTLAIRSFLALIFPVLCLAFSVAPNSKIGSLLCNPIVNMTCHIMSDLIFVMLMIVRLILLTEYYECDCLGTQIYPIDWVIWLWVLARIVNQLKKIRETSLGEMLRNAWTLNDLITSILFIVVIVIKIYYVSVYKPNTSPFECPTYGVNASEELKRLCTRSKWTAEEIWPITISEAALAIIYFLIHIRAMELLYTDRTFGPLQLSLDKMLVDTTRFLFIFFVTFAGFAFAMTQLYWAWGMRESFQGCNGTTLASDVDTCEQESDADSCKPVYSTILNSFLEQYWTLYGYGWGREPPSAAKIACDGITTGFTEIAGQAVSMIFHAWAVVVMLNMLVAMLSHSFDRVRNNAELEWKFHRSRTWMKFIRKGVYPRPPPMNLVPSTRDFKSFWNFIKKKFSVCFPDGPSRHNAQREARPEGSQRENLQYRQALKHITHRYTRRYLLPDFKHTEIEQQSQPAPINTKSMSVSEDQLS